MKVRMTQNMFVCDICGNEMSSSHYHLPAETKEANEIKNTEHLEYIAYSTIGFLSKEQLENFR